MNKKNISAHDQDKSKAGQTEETSALKRSSEAEEEDKKRKTKEVQKPENPLEALKEEKDALYDRLLREKAAFENYRKRTEREKQDLRDYVRGEVIVEFLSVYDNFERAMEHMDSDDPKNICEGVELIYKQLSETLVKMGVKPVDGVGAPFDPRFHEAISQEETTEMPDRSVLRVFQKGYLLNDRLLRPAKVIVASNKKEEEAGKKAEDDKAD